MKGLMAAVMAAVIAGAAPEAVAQEASPGTTDVPAESSSLDFLDVGPADAQPAPAPAAADRRIEAASGLRHRPLATLGDRPAGEDPAALALWQAHLARQAAPKVPADLARHACLIDTNMAVRDELPVFQSDDVYQVTAHSLLLFSLALLERDGALRLFNWIAALAAIAFFGFSSGQLVGYTVDLFQRWF